jgi:hypothetical protein
MQIAARLAVHTPAPDKRRSAREVVALSAALCFAGYHGQDVIVREISEVGFKVQTDQQIARGSIVRLRLPGLGMVLGRVIWRRGRHVCGEFINPLSPERLRLAIGVRHAIPA